MNKVTFQHSVKTRKNKKPESPVVPRNVQPPLFFAVVRLLSWAVRQKRKPKQKENRLKVRMQKRVAQLAARGANHEFLNASKFFILELIQSLPNSFVVCAPSTLNSA